MRPGPRCPAAAPALALALSLALLCSPAAPASFFGENHLQVPMATALTRINLELQFSTAQPEALLFLAAGQADHLLLQLLSGRLQVRLVLGPEELRLQAPGGPPVTDGAPHTALLSIADGWAALSVDGLNTSAAAPGAPLEAAYGVFVGGSGGLALPYLRGASRPLRGCLHVASLNGRSLLRPLTPGVQEGCAEEFSAGDDVALGFSGVQSLAAFPAWQAQDEGTLELTLTTRSPRAPLAFQAGGRRGDFIYVDIFAGHLRAVVEKAQGTVLLHNSVPVDDGQPHEVSIRVDAQRLEISVDQYPTRTSNRGPLGYVEPGGHLLLGGLDAEAAGYLQGHRLGLAPPSASLEGCVEDLRVNGRRHGLRDAQWTRHMAAGCKNEEDEYEEDVYGQYDVLSTLAPDIWPAVELPEPCVPEPGLPPAFANFTRLLTIRPLAVAEGGAAWLEWRHVQPTLDLTEAEMRRSQVLFRVSRGPRHGQLELDIPGAQARKMFTLLDVVNRKVRFVHDGSEDASDQLVLEVSVTARGPVPGCLRQGQIYLLPVEVSPVDDPPRVLFPQGGLMTILENTQKPLGPEIVQAYDPDSPCESLTFQILGASTGLPVERREQPGEPTAEFSCQDLERGDIVYVHRRGPAQDLSLRVSDGLQASAPATLRVVAVRPTLRVRHSTGLRLAQGSIAAITPANLSVETNAVGQDVSVLFRVTGALQFGELQKRGAGGAEGTEWWPTQAFHQRDVDQHRVRYVSTDPARRRVDAAEDVALEVQVGQETLDNLSFPVSIQRAAVWMRRLTPLHTRDARPQPLTAAHLEAALEEEAAAEATPSPSAFRYHLVQPPKKGNLQLRGARLAEGQSFTQDDIHAGRVSYVATTRESQATEDAFRFRITVPPHFSPLYTFPVHVGGDPDAPVLTNAVLSVPEGGHATLTPQHLFIKSLHGDSYVYEVIESPRHGRLVWQPPRDAAAPVTTFTNDDLRRGLLQYRHDHSETTEDDVPFVATRQGESSGGDAAWEEVRGVFRVAIRPVNDHAPRQVVNRVFRVARGGRRLLTTDDVAFSDADSDASDAQLVLTRKDLLFGSVVAVDDPARPVYRFTQEDLRAGRILFVHSGADHGWLQLQVSDGQHQTTAMLEVQASEPYLRVANGSGLVVPQGGQGTVDTAAFHLETNLDIRSGEEVHYRVTAGPRWGQLLRAGQPATAFSQQDLLDGKILYSHNGSLAPRDAVGLSVEAGPVRADAILQVTIMLDSTPAPPQLLRHQKIYAFQGDAARIGREQLEVSQEAVSPADIVFSVKTPPAAGHLVSQGPDAADPRSLGPVGSFSQEDVNAGRVFYVHTGPEAEKDAFSLDVASGLGAPLEGVLLELEVLPRVLPLEAQNFSVPEGGARILAPPLIRVPGPRLSTLPGLRLHVLDPPQHGALRKEGQQRQDQTLLSFSWREVEEQRILYEHDGSETLMDRFVLVANASGVHSQSAPVAFAITIQPVNDQPPVLTTNRGLQMWEGATVSIPPEALRGTDSDSGPDDLVYTIEQPSNGRVALRAAPGDAVQHFSQAQLDGGLVLFSHTGALDGGFRFALSDGAHVSPGHFFRVTAQKQVLLSLDGSRTLTVCPESVQPLSSQSLRASSSASTEPQHLQFRVLRGPQLGRLLRQQGGSAEPLLNFSQAEVYAGHVLYEHQASPEPFWEAQDIIELMLSSPPAPDVAVTLTVTVTFQAACPQRPSRLWRNKGLWVPEGQRAAITPAALDAANFLASVPASQRPQHDVLFQLTQFPTRGQLWVSGEPLHAGSPHFLQSQLAAGQLAYAHGGGGTQPDSFRFRAQLQGPAGVSATAPHTSEAFTITVRDVNERPPQPQASAPLRLTRGSRAPISRAQLSVVDPDSAPEEIEYQVQRAPHNGFLSLAGGSPGPVARFTQADVDGGRLAFVANGSSVAGVLELSVSDGASPQRPVSLAVEVLPSTLEVQTQAPLEVPQASGRSPLSQQQLQVFSDRPEPDVAYRVTQGPRHGQLLVGGQPASAFSQLQVDRGEVIFTFTNFSSPHDRFGVLALARGANATATVNVTVRALLRVWPGGPWPQGATLRLDRGVLDAGELANLTGTVPHFRLLQGPRHGRLVPTSQARTESRNSQLVEGFTQRDLEAGRLGLEVDRPEGPSGPVADRLTLELWAPGVPPAVASVDFITEPYDAARSYGVALLRVPEVVRTEAGKPEGSSPTGQPGPAAASPGPTAARGGFLGFLEANMFSIIIPVCLVLLLLALILPLLFYLRKRNKTGKHHVQVLTAKPRNGFAGDTETFRKVEPGQAIALTAVPGQGPPPGGQPDPELLQFCRTPNPALRNGQYWV
ncbi:chondroitin sulfate proteoglycan 4 [Dipodomys merriami]|uniref:chondroitin sulfate proteoglycan 4 n=1 Tax=Dipodomys merriami TaxID=94247 RepID=UPI003855C97A